MKLTLAAVIGLTLSGCIVHASSRHHSMAEDTRVQTEVLVVEKSAKADPAKLAESCKVALADAIGTALAKVPGKALSAVVERDDGKAVIEVVVLSEGKTYEVEIDAATGDVLEVEQEEDDDDDDDMDDDDGDDD